MKHSARHYLCIRVLILNFVKWVLILAPTHGWRLGTDRFRNLSKAS